MKVGDRVSTQTADTYDGYTGVIVDVYREDDFIEYFVEIESLGDSFSFAPGELEVIEDA